MRNMSTREVIAKYFGAVDTKGDWQSLVSDDMSFRMPNRTTSGKASYVEITGGFLRAVRGVEINEMIVEGEKACVVASYHLRSPEGNTSTKEVVEILSVKGGKLSSSSIYFDTEDFKVFMEQ